MTADLRTSHYDAAGVPGIYDTLIELYADVHADAGDGFYSTQRYRQQLDGHLRAPGFELVTGHLGGVLVGYIYGFPLPAGTRWWQGMRTDVPEGLLDETGDRTFAISELLVRPAWQGQGIGHRLHDKLLTTRHEERATLLVRRENPAAAMYTKWGWVEIGQLRPPSWPDAPVYGVLMLPLDH